MCEERKDEESAAARQLELACARALLDELEIGLRAGWDEGTRCAVVVQAADQLARVALRMKLSETSRRLERVSLEGDAAEQLASLRRESFK